MFAELSQRSKKIDLVLFLEPIKKINKLYNLTFRTFNN